LVPRWRSTEPFRLPIRSAGRAATTMVAAGMAPEIVHHPEGIVDDDQEGRRA
jgi:hypothetical protein